MTLVEAIRARLLEIRAVTDLVGDRVYPVSVPAKAKLPAITVRRISYEPEPHLGGQADNETRRIEVTLIAETYPAAVALGELVRGTYREAGDDVDGLNGWERAADPQVNGCEFIEEMDDSYFDNVTGSLGFLVKQEYELDVLV